MHARLSEEEIGVIEDLASAAREIAPRENVCLLNLLGRIRNICYLKRAEIRMQKRIYHRCEVEKARALHE